MNNTSVPDDKILFLLKTMRHEFLDDTINKGRFCFNQPAVFSKWEDESAAQADRWEAHDAYEAIDFIAFPIIGEKDGVPLYGKGVKNQNKVVIHMQDDEVARSFICCFRLVTPQEVTIEQDNVVYSLGPNADRIIKEFGHDTYIMVPAAEFLKRFTSKIGSNCMQGAVVYADLLNNVDLKFNFNVPENLQSIAEQLFRKDMRFAWQQEFRIALPPDPNVIGQRKIVEIGSIKDIAYYGKISDLRN